MIKVTLELDYPNFHEAHDNDPYLSALIGSDKCISFERKEELSGIKEFLEKRNEHEQKIYADMGINPENVSKEVKDAIQKTALEWASNNYYYHYYPINVKNSEDKS